MAAPQWKHEHRLSHEEFALSSSIKYATEESEVIWLEAIIVTKANCGSRKEEAGLTYLSVFMSIPCSQDTFCSLNAE